MLCGGTEDESADRGDAPRSCCRNRTIFRAVQNMAAALKFNAKEKSPVLEVTQGVRVRYVAAGDDDKVRNGCAFVERRHRIYNPNKRR